ncbi:ATPase family AAA domain-containing protein 2-like [Glandiceps talaboti]
MVKTRHGGGADLDESTDFLSLNRRRTRRSSDYRDELADIEDENSRDIETFTKKTPRSQQKKNDHSYMNGTNEPRRSSRQRKPLYGTYNASLLGEISLSGAVDVMPHMMRGQKQESKMKREDNTEESESDSESESETDEEERRRREIEEEEFLALDMYSRVKRKRPPPKERNVYGVPINDGQNEETADSDDSDDSDSSEGEDSSEERPRQKYFLREKKSAPQRFIIQPEAGQRRKKNPSLFDSPSKTLRKHYQGPMTPMRSPSLKRRRHATHNSSSTSSSSSDSSDDERRFERRKAKSMARARMRCLPMNLLPEDVAQSGLLKDRTKIGTSLADVDPMTIDRSVTFETVGGLGRHIQALKEMVVFPLLYPEVFERFKITPPRGVLFHGPPGTGKTLVARALANECSREDKRVSFFMRKGADCLSKWVGESERQLRLLFDQAYTMRPSIIFFDEIDGLAPVRSSRQDQIHSSIVSTLLALMDGLDNRGEIVVIGATNRIDSIDPALRRPGRFDREFLFPLPSADARFSILKIHTKEWSPKLCDPFLKEVAERCVGYVGADIKALCTEAALLALRRRYPQIYATNEKLQLDVNSIQMSAKDFFQATQNIVPTSQRSVTSPGHSLTPIVRPLLQNVINEITDSLNKLFPVAFSQGSSNNSQESLNSSDMLLDALDEDDSDDDSVCIFENQSSRGRGRRSLMPQFQTTEASQTFLRFSSSVCQSPSAHRPRLLIAGEPGQGQSSHLAPSILHSMERFPVYCLDLPALFGVSVKTPEESCAQVFREARRTAPSIIYMPHIEQWWNVINETLRATFLTLLQDLPPSSPVLLLATSESKHMQLDSQVQQLFNPVGGEVINVRLPNEEERRNFFHDVIIIQAAKPPPRRKQAAVRVLEELPVAPQPEPRKLNDTELQRLHQQEEMTMRELRLFLRNILTRLASDRKFKIFTRPVDLEEVPDYLDVIKTPMDMSSMMKKIDLHHYNNVKGFLDHVRLICNNALEYNPDRDPSDKIIRHRACELQDVAQAIVDSELDPEFEKMCDSIVESRKRRGYTPAKTAPNYYHVKPLEKPSNPVPSTSTAAAKTHSPPTLKQNRKANGMDMYPISEVSEYNLSDYMYHMAKQSKKKPKRRISKWSRGLVSTKKKPRAAPKSDEGTENEVNEQDQDQDTEERDTANEEEGEGVETTTTVQSSQKKRKRRRSSAWAKGYVRKPKTSKRKVKIDGQETEEEDDKDQDEMNVSMEDDGNDPDQDMEEHDEMDTGNEDENIDIIQREPLRKKPRRRRSAWAMGNATKRKPTKPKPNVYNDNNEQKEVEDEKDTENEEEEENNVDNEEQKCDESREEEKESENEKCSDDESIKSGPVIRLNRQRLHSSEVDEKSEKQDEVHDKENASDCGVRQTRKLSTSDSNKCVDAQNNVDKDKEEIMCSTPIDNGEQQLQECDPVETNKEIPNLTKETDQTTEIEDKDGQEKEKNTGSEAEVMEEESAPMIRMTRARSATLQGQKAIEILQEPTPPLVVDHDKLKDFLDYTVKVTCNFNIENLEKLHSVLCQCIYTHRKDYDKTTLIEEMFTKVTAFSQL